ncbi:MAG: TraR/DksA C4-type zinc finger protein [Nitrospirae bacterium]|nr:TraR/DksA C4-type zinc finger protein [Nitrospirota bacterium]
MAAAKKKAPARKQAASAAKKTVKAKADVSAKAKPQTLKASGKKVSVSAPAKSLKKKNVAPKKAAVAKSSSLKAKKNVAIPLRGKTVPQKKAAAQKPENKDSTLTKSTVPKKGAAVVAPSSERFRGLKSMLIAKRDALLKEAKQEIQKYVSGENRQLVDTAIDEADWAAVEISEDINLKRLSAQRQLLNDVEECLRKVNEGTYGICEDCGEEISEKRLRVIPTATLCIDCKEQREKMAMLDQESEI